MSSPVHEAITDQKRTVHASAKFNVSHDLPVLNISSINEQFAKEYRSILDEEEDLKSLLVDSLRDLQLWVESSFDAFSKREMDKYLCRKTIFSC